MKKIVTWILILTLTAALSIGATLAYLTDTDEDVNVMTLGKVKIDQLEYERIDDETANGDAEVQEFHDNKPLYPAITEKGFDYTPGDTNVDWAQIGKDGYTSDIWDPTKINNELDKMVFIKNKGDYDAYVRSVFAFEAGKYTTLDEFRSMVHLNLNETDYTWEWELEPVTIGESTYFVATATYKNILAPGALTEISLSQIALDKTATNEDVEAFGETYQVLVKSQGIQADGFEGAAIALDEGFRAISETSLPWDSDAATKGIDLMSALHYLEGDTTTAAITTQVNTVTFGLTKDYRNIADSYDGTLVDVEQDVPVYAYYTPAGTAQTRAAGYDIYFLANDDIYTPVDSMGLFSGMTALKSLNTDNMNTSRTEKFASFLRDCSSLTSLDVSDWDTSNAIDFTDMFRKCASLKELDLSSWNTQNVTSLQRMFRECTNLKTANLSSWNTEKVLTATQMCALCSNLVTIDTTGWKLGSITDVSYMFYSCPKLTGVVGSGTWDLSNVTTTYCMFEYDTALAALDVTNWGMNKVENARFMFDKCSSMKDFTGEENWKLDNVVDLRQMFMNCNALTALDSEGWGMGKAQDLYLAFGNCHNMEYIQTGSWDTGNFVDMTGTFQHCYKLTTIDSSNWNTSNVTSMWGTFNASTNLETLDVSNWDVSKVTNFTMMFQGNGSNKGDMKIKELDLSNWNPVSAEKMGHMFYGCAQLTELDLSNWNMPNLYTTSHMFADCYNLETIDVSGWQTGNSWLSMDAMFNDCRKVKTLDVSSWTTSGVKEFSQIFESCYSLKEIKGLENWNTSNGNSFDETFMNCTSLKELNLSGWDTRNAKYGNKHLNGDISKGFSLTFNNVTNLTKLTLGENFDFDGNGTVTKVANLPNPPAIDGQATHWYNAANDTYYTASEIPSSTAATYVAAVKP